MKSVSVRIPASTSNLGPGYDCLGVALAVYNLVTTCLPDPRREAAARETKQPPHPMADEVAQRFFEAAGCEPFPYEWHITGDVPMSRGLGSSVTLRLGLLHGLNILAGRPLDRQRLFEICAHLEGHPDNAAPRSSAASPSPSAARTLRERQGRNRCRDALPGLAGTPLRAPDP